MDMEKNYTVEAFRKRAGGKVYRDVRFRAGTNVITVSDIVTATDEKAVQKARELLRTALDGSA